MFVTSILHVKLEGSPLEQDISVNCHCENYVVIVLATRHLLVLVFHAK